MGSVSTPTEVKAQGIALLVLGRSCREVERELGRLFPNETVPHFTTIARWLKEIPGRSHEAHGRWCRVMDRAAKLVWDYLESGTRVSPLEALDMAMKSTDIILALERRQEPVTGNQ